MGVEAEDSGLRSGREAARPGDSVALLLRLEQGKDAGCVLKATLAAAWDPPGGALRLACSPGPRGRVVNCLTAAHCAGPGLPPSALQRGLARSLPRLRGPRPRSRGQEGLCLPSPGATGWAAGPGDGGRRRWGLARRRRLLEGQAPCLEPRRQVRGPGGRGPTLPGVSGGPGVLMPMHPC